MADRSNLSESTLLLIGAPKINNLNKNANEKDVEDFEDADDRQCVEHQHPGQKKTNRRVRLPLKTLCPEPQHRRSKKPSCRQTYRQTDTHTHRRNLLRRKDNFGPIP